jgi:hypothetical protein
MADNRTVMKEILAMTSLGLSMGTLGAADLPSADIASPQIEAKLFLPDAQTGFYRGTRFDWSGVIYSLRFQGHDFYGPWFNKTDPDAHDFVYRGQDIVAGPCSAITGPVDEFDPVGWDEAKAGGTFVKIGIGALRKPDGREYDHYRMYDLAGPGKWTIHQHADSVEFVQELADASGYGYVYRKTVRLIAGKAEMVLEHSLKNTGSKAIHTTVYNHNFLVMDGAATGAGFVIKVPYTIQSKEPPDQALAEIRGKEIVYVKTLTGQDVVATPMEGFGGTAADHSFTIENARLGAGMRMQADRPLFSASLWSIRTVIAVEPYVAISIEPGNEFSWKSSYTYYTIPK